MGLNLHTYRYGEAGLPPGFSIGATRYPPRGVAGKDYVRLGYFHLRMPLLSPSRELLSAHLEKKLNFAAFASRYRTEMRQPGPQQVIQLLAALAQRYPINLGCVCADAARCHRTVLSQLIVAAANKVFVDQNSAKPRPCASPPCFMPEIED